jgi:hypothetical protein
MLCFTLDSVNYKQQTGNGTSTQLVQISNKLKGGYRFGFNGQEKVDEIAGAGNHTTAEFWEYDTRLGRRWNRDPVVKPWESSYACFANNPIWYSDVNGDDPATPLVEDHNEAPLIDGPNDPIGGGGGGGAAAGGGLNSKNSVGGDQLRKHARQLAASGIGMESNGGGSDKNNTLNKNSTWDPVTNNRIEMLDPRVKEPAANFINKVQSDLGIKLRIVQGFRSISEQNDLYSIGRTTPGLKVTNARGGQSFHNYGLAIDVVIMKNGKPDWSKLPDDAVKIGIKFGFEWGGNWSSFKDYPHFQMTFGQSINQLQSK